MTHSSKNQIFKISFIKPIPPFSSELKTLELNLAHSSSSNILVEPKNINEWNEITLKNFDELAESKNDPSIRQRHNFQNVVKIRGGVFVGMYKYSRKKNLILIYNMLNRTQKLFAIESSYFSYVSFFYF